MTAARVMDEQTILPDAADSAEVVDLLQVLRDRGHQPPTGRARLVSADGSASRPIPDGLHDILVKALEALASGYAVTIAPQHTTLTTQQAADMLGISRPTLTKLLEEGKIPHERPNSHRRIKLADVLRYQEQRRVERRQLLDQLTAESIALGLYDLTANESTEGDDNQV